LGIGADGKESTDNFGNYIENRPAAVAWQILYEKYKPNFCWEEEFLKNINSIFPWTGGTQWLKKTVVDNREIYVPLTENAPILHEIGELSDFITDEL
jgi:hypothetical protein